MYRGIDVSNYQGEINFVEVKKSGVDVVIIRAGYGSDISQQDTSFKKNIEKAKEAGLKVGAYWFCYARSPEDAVIEAEVCHEVIKDYELDYPIFYDFEEASVDYLIRCNIEASVENCSANVESFCNTMAEKGYCVGIYSNPNTIANYLDERCEKYSLWLARWPQNPNLTEEAKYGNYNVVIWQYANHQDGTIEGIGNVDCDMIYSQPGQCGYTKQQANDDIGDDTLYHVGDVVTFDGIYISSTSSEKLTPLYTTGTITKVIAKRRNPYLINDIMGWINDECIIV